MPVELVGELAGVDHLVAQELDEGAAEALVEKDGGEEPEKGKTYSTAGMINLNVLSALAREPP